MIYEYKYNYCYFLDDLQISLIPLIIYFSKII